MGVGPVAELRARTIVEAQLYLDLLRADVFDDDPGDPEGWSTLVERPSGWTLHADGAGGAFAPFDVRIDRADEVAARRVGARFGTRPSTLIDAGQWLDLGAEYVELAIEAELAAAAEPGDRALRENALLSWRFAVDVAAEVLRFLPDGADEVPASAFWTERGRQARAVDPGRFTRAELTHRLDTYRQLLDDFVRLGARS